MEAKSLNGLRQIVERAEKVTTRIRALKVADEDVRIPDVPLPLSLEATEGWLEIAVECCRKPLLARSRRLLEAKQIATATIPAAVLDRPDTIAELLQRVDGLHGSLHASAYGSVGRALTKGIEDAESVVAIYTAASRELSTLADSRPWIVALAAARIAETPSDAIAEVGIARRVLDLCNAATRSGVEITAFDSLADASTILTRLNTLIQEYGDLGIAEGLSDERVALSGLSVHDAENKVLQATANVRSEKNMLVQEAQAIGNQLELIGGENCNFEVTVGELRKQVPRLRETLEERRRVFQESLGLAAYHVVESLAQGALPTAETVTDEELGNAIRKAVACGYRFELEAPRENQ